MHKSIKASKKEALILAAIQQTFTYEVNGWLSNALLISVRALKCYKDNRMVLVYLSCLPSQEGDKMLQEVEKYKSKIQAAVHKKLANKLYTMPLLRFALDNTVAKESFFINTLLAKDAIGS